MEFNQFKEESCGRNEKGLSKSTLGLIYCVPVKTDDDTDDYELSIDSMMTITKPSINLTYITDPFRMEEFIRLDLEFISGYDPDINEIYDFLKTYEKNASDFFDDISKSPAFSIQIVPNIILTTNDIHYLELNMPMMISLISNKVNQIPNIISILFTVENCSIHEEELTHIDEVKREIAIEKMEDEQLMNIKMEDEKNKIERQKKMQELQKQLNDIDPNQHIIKVGRGSNNENTENKPDHF